MNSSLLPQFFTLYRALPEDERQRARQSYKIFQENPHHPSLRFRQVHPTRPIYSARVGTHHRVVRIRDGGEIFWYWIGSHAEYDQLLRQLSRPCRRRCECRTWWKSITKSASDHTHGAWRKNGPTPILPDTNSPL
jgi:hypothetical protein